MDQVSEGRKIVGACIGLAGAMVPALLYANGIGGLELWLPIAAVFGVAAGVILLPLREWYAGVMAGGVGCAGAFLLAAWWASWRSSVYSSEMILIELVGAVPGLLILPLLGLIRGKR
jgi:hypothetical protein